MDSRKELRPRAVLVALASFLCNGIIFGVINSYSVFYVQLHARFLRDGNTDAASHASLIGALAMGMTFLLSPVAGILVDRAGIRLTTLVGAALASAGMLAASFASTVVPLCLTYGVMFGVGSSLVYTPSLVILGHYFKRYLGIVNGFVTAGSSVFTIAMPHLLNALVNQLSLEATMRVLAGLMAAMMLCALLFRPVSSTTASPQQLLNTAIWTRWRYVIWALAVPVALFGYFIPYIHMLEFVKKHFPEEDGKLLITCLGATSGIGRLVFGKIADIPKVDRILLQQISFFSIGSLTMLLPFVNRFWILIVIALCMGLFDGCFISLLGPIAFDICGKSGASQAIGFLLGFCSIPLTVGPAIAGAIYDSTQSYTIPFLLSGIPPIVGALVLFFVRCTKTEPIAENGEKPVKLSPVANGNTPAEIEEGSTLLENKMKPTIVRVT